MPPLPIISGDECIAAVAHFGYKVVRQTGSHVRLRANGHAPLTVPVHKGKTLKRGTLAAILRAAEISADDFVAALRRR